MAKKAKSKNRQKRLPGMADPKCEEIENAAEACDAANSKAGAASEKAKEAQINLLEVMNKHDKTRYEYDGKVVKVVNGKTKAVVEEAEDVLDRDDLGSGAIVSDPDLKDDLESPAA